MIRHLLRKPLLPAATALAVVAVSGAGYAVTTENDPTFALNAEQRQALAVQADAAETDAAFRRAAVERAEDERAARLAAERAAAEEAARQAKLEAERQARLEAERAAEAERQAAAERASRAAQRDPRSAARAMLRDYGWGSGQFDCLDTLWQRESGWKHTADNPTSSAYGIPQALPGSKMASAGSDWRTNPVTQIEWGLGYISNVYGSPCGALEHSNANGWY